MTDRKDIILQTDPDIVEKRTVELWFPKGSNHSGYAIEDLARLEACTHHACKGCGAYINKYERKCASCRHQDDRKKYEAMPLVEWDEHTPLCLYDGDEEFSHPDDVLDYSDRENIPVSELMLVLCEPTQMPFVDGDDYFDSLLPEDKGLSDVAPDIAEAFDRLNEAIAAHKEPISWHPGKQRVKVEPYDD